MSILGTTARDSRLIAALLMLACFHKVFGQTPASSPGPQKFEIIDNSFLVEEAFNQEAGVFQNIFVWTRDRDGVWGAAFTQEWPAPNVTHQFSYTLPFAGDRTTRGIGDVLLNYRYQLSTEAAGRPAVSPRVSLILPTGRSGLGHGVTGLQINVPLSKQFGDVYLHANVGWTWFPRVTLDGAVPGATVNLTTPQVAGSAIWRVAPMLNLMLEAVAAFEDDVEEHTESRSRSVTVSPGLRRGWNFGDRQFVVGVALPITRSSDLTTAAALVYLSYELPFRSITAASALRGRD
jgi:hypothetical protein